MKSCCVVCDKSFIYDDAYYADSTIRWALRQEKDRRTKTPKRNTQKKHSK